MEARFARRPVLDFISSRGQSLLILNASCKRHESSYRRTKQRLNIRPDPSFSPTNDPSPQDHIIFNPPSSALSVFHTPLKFIPKEDKRRQFLAATRSGTPTRLPPPINKQPKVPHHHLNEEQIAEMQKLRLQDPDKWTNAKLARRYNCSSFFVTTCFSTLGEPSEKYQARATREQAKLEAVKERWGTRRRLAREDRAKRTELALKDL